LSRTASGESNRADKKSKTAEVREESPALATEKGPAPSSRRRVTRRMAAAMDADADGTAAKDDDDDEDDDDDDNEDDDDNANDDDNDAEKGENGDQEGGIGGLFRRLSSGAAQFFGIG
jgi:hypothetical protein